MLRFVLVLLALALCAGVARAELRFEPLSGRVDIPLTGFLRLTDLDGNGSLDLIGSVEGGEVVTCLGDGVGHFGPVRFWNLGFEVLWVGAAELDGQGSPEILVQSPNTTGETFTGALSVVRGIFDGGEPKVRPIEVGMPVYFAQLVDLDEDGRVDALVREAPRGGLTSKPLRTRILPGLGEGRFGAPIDALELATPGFTLGMPMAWGDLDGDGRTDLVEARTALQVWLAGEQRFSFAALPPVTFDPPVHSIAAIRDLDGDGHVDLLCQTIAGVALIPGAGDGSFGAATELWAGQGEPGLADLDADGIEDLVIVDFVKHQVLLKAGYGLGVFGEPVVIPMSERGDLLALADMDGDGRTDIVLSGVNAAPNYHVSWLRNMSSTPLFESPAIALAGRREGAMAVVIWDSRPATRAGAFHVDRLDGGGAVRLTSRPLVGAGRMEFRETPPAGASARYRVCRLLPDGGEVTAGEVILSTELDGPIGPPASLGLQVLSVQGHRARLALTLGEAGEANLAVVDVRGRLVRTLLSGRLGPGPREVVWDGRDGGGRPAASGVYLVRASSGELSAVRRLVLLP